MENRASYTLVGGFVLSLIIAGFVFVAWIARHPDAYSATVELINIIGHGLQ